MQVLRKALQSDVDFLVKADMDEEGITRTGPPMNKQELQEHRKMIEAFVTDNDKEAWVYEDSEAHSIVGMILGRYRSRQSEEATAPNMSYFRELDAKLFPTDGRFCEVFSLWVDPMCRRRGMGTNLKKQLEIESLKRDIKMIYTHTEEENSHVLELNRKLGYREIRRGPIWDEVIRVSLVKDLG